MPDPAQESTPPPPNYRSAAFLTSASKLSQCPPDDGWEVSGHYRRGARDKWHPYLLRLDTTPSLVHLAIKDDDRRLAEIARTDPKLTLTP